MVLSNNWQWKNLAEKAALNTLFGEISNGVIIMPNICMNILLTKHYYLLINLQYLHGKSNNNFTVGGCK